MEGGPGISQEDEKGIITDPIVPLILLDYPFLKKETQKKNFSPLDVVAWILGVIILLHSLPILFFLGGLPLILSIWPFLVCHFVLNFHPAISIFLEVAYLVVIIYLIYLIVKKVRTASTGRKKVTGPRSMLSEEEVDRWNIIEWEKQRLREQEARYFDAWYARAREFPDQTEPWEKANPIMNPDVSVDEIYQDPDEYYRKKWGDYPKSA